MTIEQELAEYRRPEVGALMEKNQPALGALFSAYALMKDEKVWRR